MSNDPEAELSPIAGMILRRAQAAAMIDPMAIQLTEMEARSKVILRARGGVKPCFHVWKCAPMRGLPLVTGLPPVAELKARSKRLVRVIKRQESAARKRLIAFKGGTPMRWAALSRYPGIEISESGYARKIKGHKMLAQTVTASGYVSYNVGSGKVVGAHRLVAMAFLPNPLHLPEVNHIDLDRSHNHVSNLEWVTSATNMGHTKRLAIESFQRSAAIVRAHALDYADNPRVQEALAKAEAKINALADSIADSIDGDHYVLAFNRLRSRAVNS